MAITRPCYSNRDDVMRAPDFKESVITVPQVDRALQDAAENIESQLHRIFYPFDATLFLDWPNYLYEEPWKISLGRHDLVALTQLQSPGNTGGSGGVAIPLWQVMLEPVNRRRGFPFTRIELDRSTVAAFGAAPTPQHSVWPTGTWGFTADADPAGSTVGSITSSGTTVTVTDGSQLGAGDVAILGYGRGAAPFPAYPGTAGAIAPYVGERVIVQDKATAATGLTQAGGGCTAISNADNVLATTGSGTLNPGEVLLLDAERMLIKEITPAGTAVVERAWDGTVLATHSGATVYAYRALTVVRGELGTTASAWNSATAIYRHRPPQTIRDLSIAEAVNQVLQETSGYARTVGAADAAMPAPGVALADKWDEAITAFGRKARIGAI